MDRWKNKLAVVTGASAGIGAAIVKDLIKNNIRVIGLARRREKIEEIRNELSETEQNLLSSIKCDVSNEDDVKKVFEFIQKEFGNIDILVNNAGTLRVGDLVTVEISKIQDVINTNIMGVIYCTREAFKIMKEKNIPGHLIFINSVCGHRVAQSPTVSLNVYCPTKFCITAMVQTFRNEFKNLGIKIKTTSISPGLVKTDMVPDSAILSQFPALDPKDVANAVMFALSTPPEVQISELTVEAHPSYIK